MFQWKEIANAVALNAWADALMILSPQLEKARAWEMPIADNFLLQFNASRMYLERHMHDSASKALKAMRAIRESRESGSIPDGSAT